MSQRKCAKLTFAKYRIWSGVSRVGSEIMTRFVHCKTPVDILGKGFHGAASGRPKFGRGIFEIDEIEPDQQIAVCN